MRVVVHIGTPKAGSSAIQQALHSSHDDLAADRVLAFAPGKLFEAALFMVFAREDAPLNPEMRLHFASVGEARAWSCSQWEEFEQAACEANYDTAVLSSEHFVNVARPKDLLERLSRNFASVQCVAYLRDPVSFYTSQLDQLLRGGARLRDIPGPNKFNFHHVRNLIKFMEVFGRGNVHVRPFLRDRLVDGDVVADFEQTISTMISAPVTLKRPPPTNESTPGILTALCASANAQALSGEIDYRRRKMLIRAAREMPDLRSAPRLSLKGTPLERTLLYRSRNNCSTANERFFGGEAVFEVIEEPPPVASQEEIYRELVRWLTSYIPELAIRKLVATTLLMP